MLVPYLHETPRAPEEDQQTPYAQCCSSRQEKEAHPRPQEMTSEDMQGAREQGLAGQCRVSICLDQVDNFKNSLATGDGHGQVLGTRSVGGNEGQVNVGLGGG